MTYPIFRSSAYERITIGATVSKKCQSSVVNHSTFYCSLINYLEMAEVVITPNDVYFCEVITRQTTHRVENRQWLKNNLKGHREQ